MAFTFPRTSGRPYRTQDVDEVPRTSFPGPGRGPRLHQDEFRRPGPRTRCSRTGRGLHLPQDVWQPPHSQLPRIWQRRWMPSSRTLPCSSLWPITPVTSGYSAGLLRPTVQTLLPAICLPLPLIPLALSSFSTTRLPARLAGSFPRDAVCVRASW